jgi:hypothetical protein
VAIEVATEGADMRYIMLLVGLIVLNGCSSGDEFGVTCGGHSCTKPKDNPPPLGSNDYRMVQCPIYYSNFFWGHCLSNNDISVRENQPIFTALMDCQTAIGLEQQNDPLVWDDSLEDRDREWAMQLYCAGAQ